MQNEKVERLRQEISQKLRDKADASELQTELALVYVTRDDFLAI